MEAAGAWYLTRSRKAPDIVHINGMPMAFPLQRLYLWWPSVFVRFAAGQGRSTGVWQQYPGAEKRGACDDLVTTDAGMLTAMSIPYGAFQKRQ